ncbi:MAG: hypothetical protein AAB785_00070 [Patescibacteria group bacterium]
MAETAPMPSQVPAPDQMPVPGKLPSTDEKLYIPENKILPQEIISPHYLATLKGKIIRENADLWHDLGHRKGRNIDWKEITKRAEEIRQGLLFEHQNPVEQTMINCFWQTAKVITKAREAAKEGNYPLKLEASKWQLETIKSIFYLENDPDLQGFLALFWRNIDKTGEYFCPDEPELIQGIKRGILTPIAASRVFHKLDFEVYLPTSQQDAQNSTDLLLKREKPDGKVDRIALQCKGHWGESFDMSAKKMTEYKHVEGRVGGDYKETLQWNSLLTSAGTYSKMIGGAEVVPMWVDVFGLGEGEESDDTSFTQFKPPGVTFSSFPQRFEKELAKGGTANV